jgi:hypothetical protein
MVMINSCGRGGSRTGQRCGNCRQIDTTHQGILHEAADLPFIATIVQDDIEHPPAGEASGSAWNQGWNGFAPLKTGMTTEHFIEHHRLSSFRGRLTLPAIRPTLLRLPAWHTAAIGQKPLRHRFPDQVVFMTDIVL